MLVERLLLIEEVEPLQPRLNSTTVFLLTLKQIAFLGGPFTVHLSVLLVKRLVETLLVSVGTKFG